MTSPANPYQSPNAAPQAEPIDDGTLRRPPTEWEMFSACCFGVMGVIALVAAVVVTLVALWLIQPAPGQAEAVWLLPAILLGCGVVLLVAARRRMAWKQTNADSG